MRPALLLLLAILATAALAPYPDAPASASCVGPSLIGKPVLHLGEEQTVEGQFFVNGCEDSMGCSTTFGCDDCEYDDPESPMEDVLLELRQQGHRWILQTADAADSGDITWTFTLPPDVRRGHARLVADQNQPVVVMVK